MAGIPQEGLYYASIPSNFFDNDARIDRLLDAQGWRGVGVYMYLLLRAYGSHGYYAEWCYADCATTARKMGGGISAKNVEEAMHYCIQVGLWDKRLLEEWGIITSIDIQQNYLIAAKKARHKVKIISEYWLLAEKPSSGSLVSCGKNAGNCGKNADDCNKDDNKCNKDDPSISMNMNGMVKESMSGSPPAAPTKEKPIKHKHGEYGWVLLTDEQYARLLADFGEEEVRRCITYIDEGAQSTGNKNHWKDWNVVLRKCSKNGWGLGYNQKAAKPAAEENGECRWQRIARCAEEQQKAGG